MGRRTKRSRNSARTSVTEGRHRQTETLRRRHAHLAHHNPWPDRSLRRSPSPARMHSREEAHFGGGGFSAKCMRRNWRGRNSRGVPSAEQAVASAFQQKTFVARSGGGSGGGRGVQRVREVFCNKRIERKRPPKEGVGRGRCCCWRRTGDGGRRRRRREVRRRGSASAASPSTVAPGRRCCLSRRGRARRESRRRRRGALHATAVVGCAAGRKTTAAADRSGGWRRPCVVGGAAVFEEAKFAAKKRRRRRLRGRGRRCCSGAGGCSSRGALCLCGCNHFKTINKQILKITKTSLARPPARRGGGWRRSLVETPSARRRRQILAFPTSDSKPTSRETRDSLARRGRESQRKRSRLRRAVGLKERNGDLPTRQPRLKRLTF